MDRRALGQVGGGALAALLASLLALPACESTTADAPRETSDEPAPAADPVDAPPVPHERIADPSLLACGGCHTDVYAEWSESLHHRAWTNANVRTATDDFRKESCRPCHSPQPVFTTGLTRRPDYRDFNQRDGVHCLSCHGLPDGVAAARTIPDAPCKPRFDARLVDVDMCYPCHEPTHGAYAEYEESDAFALGVRCVDCHMPPVARAARKGGVGEHLGRSHGPHGGLNAEFVRKSVRWDARVADGVVEVELANRTGHRLPGEIPSRALWIQVEFDSGERTDLILRKPNKGEDRDDDRLRPDEVRTLAFPAPDAAREARVRLLFRPLPLLPPEACHDLGERVLVLVR